MRLIKMESAFAAPSSLFSCCSILVAGPPEPPCYRLWLAAAWRLISGFHSPAPALAWAPSRQLRLLWLGCQGLSHFPQAFLYRSLWPALQFPDPAEHH